MLERVEIARRRGVAAPQAAASRPARRIAAIRLDGSAIPRPAMSKAVPWSGEVRTKGRPRVTLTAGVEGQRLDRDQRLVVVHGHDDVVARTRRLVEQRVGRVRAGHRDVFRPQKRRARA